MKLTARQQIRIDIITKYLAGQIYAEDAQIAIGIGERQFRRLIKSFREDGVLSVIHGNKGREPKNIIPQGIRTQIIRLYKGRFFGLNIVHFKEKLHEELQDIPIPAYSTIRSILKKEKLITNTTNRKKRVHTMRRRYEREGVMVQIDGSHHRWFYGKSPCCLTAAIDDATGRILGAKFTKTETTFASMDVVESIIEKYGTFQMLYSDKAGIYGGGKRDGFSNMNRAMRELGIISIQANSPQAKGRVERLFRTLQSRLVEELRLKGITDFEKANEYLNEYFIPHFNSKFGKMAQDKNPAYQKVPADLKLDDVFTVREDRMIQSGHCISFKGNKYVLEGGELRNLMKKNVELRMYRNGDIKFFLNDEQLDFKILDYFSSVA